MHKTNPTPVETVEDYARRLAAQAPELTDYQRERLVQLLHVGATR